MKPNSLPFPTPRPPGAAAGGRHFPAPAPSRSGSLLRLVISTRRSPAGAELLMRVAGDLDMATAPILADALHRLRFDLRTTEDAVGIVLDLRGVGFLGVAGLHVLAGAHAGCADDGKGLRVVSDQKATTRLLSLTGLDRVLDLRPTMDGEPGAAEPRTP